MKKDCWAAGGAAGGKSKGKQKGKKKDAAALEEEPEGEANGLELCALSNTSSTARPWAVSPLAKNMRAKREAAGIS